MAAIEFWSTWGIEADTICSSGWGHVVAAVATGTLSATDALALYAGNDPETPARDPHTPWLDANGTPIALADLPRIMDKPSGDEPTPWVLKLNETALDADSSNALNRCLAELYNTGHSLSWERIFASRPGRPCSLTPTPFRRQHFELPRVESDEPTRSSLLGERLNSPLHIHQSYIALGSAAGLEEHVVNGQALLPAAAMLLMALDAKQADALADIQLGEALPLGDAPRLTHTAWLRHAERDEVQIASANSEGLWQRHLSATSVSAGPAPTAALDAFKARCTTRLEPSKFYDAMHTRGLHYGPTYQRLTTILLGDGEALGQVKADSHERPIAALDACFQLLAATYGLDGSQAYIPVSIDRFSRYAPLAGELWATVRRTGDENGQVIAGDLTIYGEAGHVVARIEGFVARCVNQTRRGPTKPTWRYSHQLVQITSSTPPTGDVLQIQDETGLNGDLSCAHLVLDLRDSDEADACGARVLRVVQHLVQQGWKGQLWLHTNGHRSRPSQAAVWGMGRCLQLEHPELSIRLLDAPDREAVWDQIGEERQVVLTDNGLCAYRLQGETRPSAGTNLAITLPSTGDLDEIGWQHGPRTPPGPGEVELEVRAAGLNFRDVLNALGAYPGDAGEPGGECSGVVRRIGEGVEDLQVGQRVMAMADGCFRSFVHVPAYRVVRSPETLSDAEAATIPVAYLTAWWALERCAALQPGERILIHAVSGGVGMAAAKIAMARGAIVYGTASKPKWDAVNAWGVERVYNSRDLSFAEAIQADTNGEGVHVVLNSLSGEFIPRSLALLADNGRFVEIGKRGIWSAEQVAEARTDVGYHVFDLAQIAVERIDDFRDAFEHISEAITRDKLALP